MISVGASTDFRFYAQTNYAAARYFATTGWLNDNISSLSSGGFDETGGTVDLVAPGDLSFASCDASPQLLRVHQLPRPAVRHRGERRHQRVLAVRGRRRGAGDPGLPSDPRRRDADPSPGQADPAQHRNRPRRPADEQGAGLLNSYKAVELAESIHTADGSPQPTGNTLLISPNQLNAARGPRYLRALARHGHEHGLIAAVREPQRAHFRLGPERSDRSVTLNDATSPQFAELRRAPEQLRGLPLLRAAGRRTG